MKITRGQLGLALLLAIVGLSAGWWAGQLKKAAPQIPGVASLTKPDTTYVGTPLPDLSWEGFDNQPHQLTDWQGKVVVVNHWATWCPPCRAEMPLFIEYQQQLGDKGLQFVGIAHDSITRGQPFLDSIGMNYPNLLAGQSQGIEWSESLGSRGSLPFTLIYGRDGKLVTTKLGEVSDAYLKEEVVPLLEG